MVSLRSALVLELTRRGMVIPHLRFGTTYRVAFQGSSIQIRTF